MGRKPERASMTPPRAASTCFAAIGDFGILFFGERNRLLDRISGRGSG